MNYKYKRVLITGGAGFVGSWLAEKLLKEGRKVFIVDNLSTGFFDNIEHLVKNANFYYEIGEATDEKLMSVMIDRCDYVCHLAASVGVKKVMEKPLQSLENNIKSTALVLKLAAKKRKPVLITSTSEVYGKNGKIPYGEADDRVYGSAYNYRWGYAFSKAIDEFLALAYWREKKLPTVVVRLFNTVGPRQSGDYGMVLPRFVKWSLSGSPLIIYGTGRQTRCFCHVKDVVEALIKITNQENVFGEIINLGTTEEVPINDLAVKVKRIAGSDSEIKHVPYNDVYGEGFEDMERRVPDISKAKRLLDWKPKMDLESIIKEMVANCRQQQSGSR